MTDIKALVMECGLNLYDTEVANENGKTILESISQKVVV